MLRAVGLGCRLRVSAFLVEQRAAITTCSPALGSAVKEQRRAEGDDQPPRAAAPPPAASAATTALDVPRPSHSLLRRTLETALEAMHRLALLVGSIRRLGANETYVRNYLERLGLDSFTLEHLHVMRPGVFKLSVARDIEPAVAWLRSIGVDGGALVELVRHTPTILSTNVDDQLEPLAALIAAAGGSPAAVLRACPGLAVVPVACLRGTRHVLRQLACTDEDVSLVLVSYPDLFAQLALTLQRLFTDFAVAGWKLAQRQQHQLAGAWQHRMERWQPPTRGHASGEATGGGGGGGEAGGGTSGSNDSAHAAANRPRPPPDRSHVQRSGGGGNAASTHLLHTSYIVDRGIYQGLLRVQAALEALPLVPEGEDREAAASQLQHAIDLLGQLAEAGTGVQRLQPEQEAAAGEQAASGG